MNESNHNKLYILQAEQMAVCDTNDGGKIPLTWGQIKNMPLTHKVWYIIYILYTMHAW